MSKFSTPFSLSASAIATALLISACGGGSAPADTTPPTVAITDNVSAATATGPVTFTFTFSEDVGTSFVVEDISVAGGTAGTLTKTDATHYSLLVTPTANTTGTINVGVTAAKFKDIALNDNTAAASATQDFNTVAAASTVIATFDEATPLTFVGFDGAEGSSIAVGPSGGSGNAFKVVRSGGQPWAGAKVTGLTMNVTPTNNTFSARVHSTEAGIVMDLKLEGTAAGDDTGDIHANEAVVVGWQTLTWTVPAAKIPSTRPNLVFLPKNGTTGTGQVYHFDDVKLGTAAALAPPPPVATSTVIATFDEATPLTFVGFDGAEGSSIAVGPSGGSGNAFKVVRSGGQPWAGAKVTGLTMNVTPTNNTFSARVHSTEAGIVMDLKLEGTAAGDDTGDIHANEAVVVGWQTLTWTVPAAKIPSTRPNLVFLPKNGTTGTGQVYHFDDVKLGTAAALAPPPPVATSTVIATFDEATPLTFVGFDGAEGSSIAVGPSGGSGNAFKVVRSGGQPWAGAKVTGLTMNVTPTNNTFSARVHSTEAGIVMDLKLEGTAAGDDTGDIHANEAVVVGWQTLTWTVPAAKIPSTRPNLVFLPKNGTTGTGQVYYFDDIKLGVGTAPPVATGCTPTTAAVSPNFVTFDGDCSILTAFEGISTATVVADPAGGTNMVARVVKPTGNTANFYAGVTMSNGATASIPTIPFTASSAKVSLRVYSAYSGMRVRLKLENAANAGVNVEHDAFTTVVNQWETLVFNLTDTTSHFIPSGATTYDATKPTANFVLTNAYNKASVFFDYGLGNIGYAAMPAERTYYFDDLKFVP